MEQIKTFLALFVWFSFLVALLVTGWLGSTVESADQNFAYTFNETSVVHGGALVIFVYVVLWVIGIGAAINTARRL